VPPFCLAPVIQAADIANAHRSHQLSTQASRLESDERAKNKQPRRKAKSGGSTGGLAIGSFVLIPAAEPAVRAFKIHTLRDLLGEVRQVGSRSVRGAAMRSAGGDQLVSRFVTQLLL